MSLALVDCLSKWWASRKRPYSEIEPAIKPLVDSLNSITGVSTIASCEGHFFGGAPYVYFKAPTQIAASVEHRLREALIKDQPVFMTDWSIEGMFNENYELTFLLHSPEYHCRTRSFLYAAWLFVVCRKRLNTDLLALATYLGERSIFPEVGQVEEPNVCTYGRQH